MQALYTSTPAGDRIEHELNKRFELLDRDSITRWFMMRSANKDAMVDFGRGRRLGTGTGTKFEGQLRELYWTAVRPGLEDTIDDTVIALDRDIANYSRAEKLAAIAQTKVALFRYVQKVYARLADHDRKLRGEGFPETVSLRDSSKELEYFKRLAIDRLEPLERRVPSPMVAAYQEWVAPYSVVISILSLFIALTALLGKG